MKAWNPFEIISDQEFMANWRYLNGNGCSQHRKGGRKVPQKTGELMSEDVDDVLFSLEQIIKALHNIKADPRSDVLFAIGAAASRLEETRDFISKSRRINHNEEPDLNADYPPLDYQTEGWNPKREKQIK